MDKLKILIIEDDISTQQLFDKALSTDQFEKQFSSNGLEALELYKSWKPDLLVLDIFMPIMTGYSLLKTIREELEDNATAVIMSTSASKPEDIQSCIKLGIQGYIVKPFNYKTIEAKIMQYYNDFQESENNREILLDK